MSNNMNINFKTNADKIAGSMSKLSNSMSGLGKAGRKTSGDFRAFQAQTRKINDAFSNMARDGNRSTKVFKGLSLATLNLNKAFGLLLTHRFGSWLRQGITSAMEMVETNELFRVSLGELTTETDEAVRSMSDLTGLDSTNLRDRVANFNLLAKTMGMTAKNSQTLGLSMNNLALDMGAVFNVSYAQVAEDLRSGLVGQSRVLYKYGIDVTNAQLAQEAQRRGIQKSVQTMSQAEKMMLRYSVILRQTSLIQGEFAHEFNFPMNQLRLFQEQFVTLSRTIGQLFLPALGAIVRVARAVAIALTTVFQIIGKFFGMDIQAALEPRDGGSGLGDIKDDVDGISDGVGGINDGVGGTGKGLGKASKEAKKLKKQLAGFDELNIIPTKAPETPSAGAGGGGGGGGGGGLGGLGEFDFDLDGYDGLLDMIEDRSQAMADSIMEWMKGVWELAEPTREALSKLWNEGLSKFANFTMGSLADFYNSFLAPIGRWTLTEGLPKFFNIINDFLNLIDWDRLRESLNGLWEALAPFAITIGEGLLMFLEDVLVPLGLWVVNEVVTTFIDNLADRVNDLNAWLSENKDVVGKVIGAYLLFTNGLKLANGVFKILAPIIPIVSKAFGLLAPIFALPLPVLGALVGAGVLLYRNWDEVKAKAKILIDVLKPLFGSTMDAFGDLWESLKGVWDSLKVVLDDLWTALQPTLSFLGTVAVGVLVGLVSVFNGVVGAIGWVVDGFVNLLGAGLNLVQSFVALFTGDFAGAFDFIVKMINKVDKAFDSFVKAIIGFVSNLVKTVVDFFKNMYKTIVGNSIIPDMINAIVKWFKDLIGWVLQPVKDLVKKVVDKFNEFKDKAIEIFINTWNAMKDTFKGVATWFGDKFTTAWTNIKSAFSGAKTWATNTWNNIKDIFKKVPDWFKTQFTNAWTNVKNVFSKGGKIFTGIKDGIASTFRTIVNGIIGGINRVIRVPFNAINGMLNTIRNVGVLGIKPFSGLWRRNPLSIPQIPRLADGGVLDMGQLFIAREAGAELVGNFGGKSAVMNNDDIVYSVTKGVYEAVRMAMSGSNGDGQPIQLQVNVLGDTVMDKVVDGVNRQNRIHGKTVINV